MAMESPTSPQTGHTQASSTGSSFRTSFSRCSQCTRQKENGRNLVVCIDGTSNQFGHNNTNVVKLFAKINLETTQPEQCAYYSSGIGTRPKSLHIFERLERVVTDKFDMAVAWNMEEIVKDAYGWLARMYREGDQIYLFGFSRGAYQVRVLAGMIHEVGLIRTPTEKQIGTAYDHYQVIRSEKPKTRQIAREFKNTFSWKDLRVHFVGVWDTVSSVGLIRGDVFLSTSSAAAHACHFRHALALDELRVKFIPEYFHEMNCQTYDGNSKYIVTHPDTSLDGTSTSVQPECTASDNGTNILEGKKTTEIKEVWFAGSHSDVGGTNRPGKSHQAGNVSLLWMRQEAAAKGLVLKPTDIVWVPDDIDFGISDSMSRIWKAVEWVPIKHQVSFSGAGEDARRWHRQQPRRIIPGQKVHVSVLYANAYKPKATLGEGFDISILQQGLEDAELDQDIWETGLFDDTAAQELLAYLGSQQGVAPIYLDRLLFMLRFKEGKQCVRNVPRWQNKFMELIQNRNCAPLVRLVTIVAYYEASCDPDAPPKSRALTHVELSQDVFNDAERCLSDILRTHKHRDGPRVVALLRPLTKHQILRERILTQKVLETLVDLLDVIITQREGNFGQAMDGLNSLLQCEDTRSTIIGKLGETPEGSSLSRLARILDVEGPRHLTAALRMVLTLARIPEARGVCTPVKHRIKQLARREERLVGLLAVEILLALYDRNDRQPLNIRDAQVRANLASALNRLNVDGCDSTDGPGDSIDPGREVFRNLFGLGAEQLLDPQKKLIRELKMAVQKGNARERTAATMTLLKLCDTQVIRAYLCEIELLDVFVDQLRSKDSALLAAYALATCLKYSEMKSVKDNDNLAKHIVGMLRLDYFDDAVGQVEGFQIFGDFMQYDDLREKIKNYDITEVLDTKLGKGKSKEIRTSLICLEIFRGYDQNGPWTDELVKRSLRHLKHPEWKAQKAGVTILSALAQTELGAKAIEPEIYKIVEMLLPEGYLLIQPENLPGQGQIQPAMTTTEFTDSRTSASRNAPSRPPSWMLGPACALRILAQNKTLRERTYNTIQYGSLKHLYLSGTLVDEADTSPLRIWTPNRTDVTNMLDKMIKAVDNELSEEGLMSIGDTMLPHIEHWNRLMTTISNQSMAALSILPALLGVSVLAILATVVVPVYLSSWVIGFLKRQLSGYQDIRILEKLRSHHNAGQVDHGEERVGPHEPEEGVQAGRDGESPPSEYSPEGSQSPRRVSGHQDMRILEKLRLRRSNADQVENREERVGSPEPEDGETSSGEHAREGSQLFKRLSGYQDIRVLEKLRLRRSKANQVEQGEGSHEPEEGVPAGPDEGPSGERAGESSVPAVHIQDEKEKQPKLQPSEPMQETTNATS